MANNRRPKTRMPIKRTMPKFMQTVINFQRNHRLLQFDLFHHCRTTISLLSQNKELHKCRFEIGVRLICLLCSLSPQNIINKN